MDPSKYTLHKSFKVYGEVRRSGPVSQDEVHSLPVHISSLQGFNDNTAADFICELTSSVLVDELILDYISVPNTIPNLPDAIILRETAQPDVVTTPPRGIYTYTNAPALLSAWLTAASPSGSVYTVTIDPFTLAVTITSTITPFTLLDPATLQVTSRNRTLNALGWNNITVQAPPAPALVQVSPGAYNFLPIDTIYVQVVELPQKSSDTQGISYTFVVPTTSISKQYITGTPRQSYKNCSGNPLARFTVRLTDTFGRRLDFIGGQCTMLFSYVARGGHY